MTTAINTTNTLIATFATYSIARQASLELEESGISADDIHIDSTQKTAGDNREEKQESGFSGWWHSLFGSEHDEEERTGYENAISSGSAILRATVPAGRVDSATAILNRLGALDVQKGSPSNAWVPAAGSRNDNSGSIEVVEEELLVGKRSLIRGGVRIYSHHVSEAVEQQRSCATSTQGSIRATGLSPHSPAPSALSGFGSTAGAGTLAGESTAGTSSDLRSGYAREFERPYGSDSSIDESDPAWEYGYANASDPRYRGKPWDDVENDLRSNYERDYPGSSWDQAKGTMRSGWDKVTGQR